MVTTTNYNAMTETSRIKKYLMWNKVRELFSDGLNKTQIGQSLGLHRQTVAKYLSMTEEAFMSSQSYDRHYGHKLDPYESYMVSELRKWPFLSSPQLHDRLKEHFADLPSVPPPKNGVQLRQSGAIKTSSAQGDRKELPSLKNNPSRPMDNTLSVILVSDG